MKNAPRSPCTRPSKTVRLPRTSSSPPSNPPFFHFVSSRSFNVRRAIPNTLNDPSSPVRGLSRSKQSRHHLKRPRSTATEPIRSAHTRLTVLHAVSGPPTPRHPPSSPLPALRRRALPGAPPPPAGPSPLDPITTPVFTTPRDDGRPVRSGKAHGTPTQACSEVHARRAADGKTSAGAFGGREREVLQGPSARLSLHDWDLRAELQVQPVRRVCRRISLDNGQSHTPVRGIGNCGSGGGDQIDTNAGEVPETPDLDGRWTARAAEALQLVRVESIQESSENGKHSLQPAMRSHEAGAVHLSGQTCGSVRNLSQRLQPEPITKSTGLLHRAERSGPHSEVQSQVVCVLANAVTAGEAQVTRDEAAVGCLTTPRVGLEQCGADGFVHSLCAVISQQSIHASHNSSPVERSSGKLSRSANLFSGHRPLAVESPPAQPVRIFDHGAGERAKATGKRAVEGETIRITPGAQIADAAQCLQSQLVNQGNLRSDDVHDTSAKRRRNGSGEATACHGHEPKGRSHSVHSTDVIEQSVQETVRKAADADADAVPSSPFRDRLAYGAAVGRPSSVPAQPLRIPDQLGSSCVYPPSALPSPNRSGPESQESDCMIECGKSPGIFSGHAPLTLQSLSSRDSVCSQADPGSKYANCENLSSKQNDKGYVKKTKSVLRLRTKGQELPLQKRSTMNGGSILSGHEYACLRSGSEPVAAASQLPCDASSDEIDQLQTTAYQRSAIHNLSRQLPSGDFHLCSVASVLHQPRGQKDSGIVGTDWRPRTLALSQQNARPNPKSGSPGVIFQSSLRRVQTANRPERMSEGTSVIVREENGPGVCFGDLPLTLKRSAACRGARSFVCSGTLPIVHLREEKSRRDALGLRAKAKEVPVQPAPQPNRISDVGSNVAVYPSANSVGDGEPNHSAVQPHSRHGLARIKQRQAREDPDGPDCEPVSQASQESSTEAGETAWYRCVPPVSALPLSHPENRTVSPEVNALKSPSHAQSPVYQVESRTAGLPTVQHTKAGPRRPRVLPPGELPSKLPSAANRASKPVTHSPSSPAHVKTPCSVQGAESAARVQRMWDRRAMRRARRVTAKVLHVSTVHKRVQRQGTATCGGAPAAHEASPRAPQAQEAAGMLMWPADEDVRHRNGEDESSSTSTDPPSRHDDLEEEIAAWRRRSYLREQQNLEEESETPESGFAGETVWGTRERRRRVRFEEILGAKSRSPSMSRCIDGTRVDDEDASADASGCVREMGNTLDMEGTEVDGGAVGPVGQSPNAVVASRGSRVPHSEDSDGNYVCNLKESSHQGSRDSSSGSEMYLMANEENEDRWSRGSFE